MDKKKLTILFSLIGLLLVAIAFVIVMLVRTSTTDATDEKVEVDTASSEMSDLEAANARADSLLIANDRLTLEAQFNALNADFEKYEDKKQYIKDDKVVAEYNAAKKRIETLLSELNTEKKSNSENREKIKELEAEIGTLRGIVRHYLEEIQRLGVENEGLRQQIQQISAHNEELSSQVSTTSAQNRELTQTVQLARKLQATNLTLRAYNKKDKEEKNVTKATKLGVSFSIAPNNAASPGNKSVAVRVLSPEGSLIGGAGTIPYDGASVAVSASRAIEYNNRETPVSVYVNASSLTPGTYTVDVFCDGYRIASSKFVLKK